MAWSTWHIAALGRVKRMPAARDFIFGREAKPVGGVDEVDVAARLHRYQEKRERLKRGEGS